MSFWEDPYLNSTTVLFDISASVNISLVSNATFDVAKTLS